MLLMLLQLPFQDRNKSLGWPADHAPASSQSIFSLLHHGCCHHFACLMTMDAGKAQRLLMEDGFNWGSGSETFFKHSRDLANMLMYLIEIYLILIDTSFDENLHRRHLDLIFLPGLSIVAPCVPGFLKWLLLDQCRAYPE